MKKLILISLVLLGCQKKAKQPVQQTTSNQSTSKVHCWYQMGFDSSYVFYKCTSSQSEYNQTSSYCASNQMNMIVKEKNNCNECQ